MCVPSNIEYVSTYLLHAYAYNGNEKLSKLKVKPLRPFYLQRNRSRLTLVWLLPLKKTSEVSEVFLSGKKTTKRIRSLQQGLI